MIKAKYKKWQEDSLRDVPLHPYELSAKGLSEIRRNVIISSLTLSLMLALVILFYRMLIGDILPKEEVGSAIRFGLFFAFCAAISFVARALEKSCDYIAGTGLMWRIAADDEFLDEWEIRQKNRSLATSYVWLGYALIGMFCLWLIVSFVALMTIGHVLPMPPFDVNIAIGIVFIYIMSTLPLIHTAWTLEPMVDDEASPEDMQRPSPATKGTTTEAKTPKTWGQRIWDLAPFVVGGGIGYWFFSREEGGLFYDFGYDIGHWFGKLFS